MKNSSIILLRNLIFLSWFLVSLVLIMLAYSLLKPTIQKYQEQKATYDADYFADAVKNAGSSSDLDPERIRNGIHVETGLKAAPGFKIVRSACTGCHSADLITQNSAKREGWEQMIRWMQATQGLPDLGKNETAILDYLAKHYAPKEVGRRANLKLAPEDWYVLNLEN